MQDLDGTNRGLVDESYNLSRETEENHENLTMDSLHSKQVSAEYTSRTNRYTKLPGDFSIYHCCWSL